MKVSYSTPPIEEGVGLLLWDRSAEEFAIIPIISPEFGVRSILVQVLARERSLSHFALLALQ